MKRKSPSNATSALHTRLRLEGADPSVTPLFQNSAFEASSPYFYTRKNNPNSEEFERVVCAFEEAKHGISVTTGMTAISLVLNLVPAGGSILISKFIYGCTYKLFQRVAARNNLDLHIVDLTDLEGVRQLRKKFDLVFFETPTNPFLLTIPIAGLVDIVRAENPDVLVAVDNTWASPLFQKPLKLGADMSLHSATKYLSGHSDVMGGIILVDRDDLHEQLSGERFYHGAILDPHSAWLLRRSLQTLSIRMKQHAVAAREMLGFLQALPQVEKVYFPEIDPEQLVDYGCIVFFEFAQPYRDLYEKFRDRLQIFQTGTGMACVTSMVAQPFSGSHASLSDDEKTNMNIGRDLVRLCFGLEDIEDLKADLVGALEQL